MVFVWASAVAALAFIASYALVGIIVSQAHRAGPFDRPRPGEVQVRSVPRTGGYAMLLALFVALGLAVHGRPDGLSANPDDEWKFVGVMLGSLAIVPLAWLDDRRRLGALPQFVGHVIIACIPIAFGLRLGSIASPFGPAVELPYWLDLLLTLLWIVGMINAINLIDVMDGLAGGIALIAAVVLCARSFLFGQYSIAVLPLALAGSVLGFLPHNFHPARIFMGSSGSMMLGYWLAVIAIIGGAKVGTAFVVLGVPILNTAWVIGRRMLAGRSPFQGGDGELLPQRMHALGLSQTATVLVLYGLCVAFGLLALTLHSPAEGPSIAKVYLIAAMVAVVATVLATVTYLSMRRHQTPTTNGTVR
jgi:UDP-GlcNAc:undecaprenyl-phosphate GlcNAc-1-phosphate transferase